MTGRFLILEFWDIKDYELVNRRWLIPQGWGSNSAGHIRSLVWLLYHHFSEYLIQYLCSSRRIWLHWYSLVSMTLAQFSVCWVDLHIFLHRTNCRKHLSSVAVVAQHLKSRRQFHQYKDTLIVIRLFGLEESKPEPDLTRKCLSSCPKWDTIRHAGIICRIERKWYL